MRFKTILTGFALVMLFVIGANAQSKKEEARKMMMEAIEVMDNGNPEKAIEMLDEALKLDKKNTMIAYEKAYAYTMKKDYEKSIETLVKCLKHKDMFDQVYQLIGINYSYQGNREKAISYFDKGIGAFPNSGILYLERGNMELFIDSFNLALQYYEKGIEVAPMFPSNYYWASKLFCHSDEEVWGLIYGEIFMNLERSSKRTAEISKLLYDTFKSEIQISGDTLYTVSFSKKSETINIYGIEGLKNFKMPFGSFVYETNFTKALAGEKNIDLNSLSRIRERFIDFYYSGNFNEKYPIVLFDFHRELIKQGHFEAYNHWLFMMGDEEAFEVWYNENTMKFEGFADWYSDNVMKLNSENSFHRKKY